MGWIWIGFCRDVRCLRHRYSPGKQDYKKIHALPARRSRLHMDPCFRAYPSSGTTEGRGIMTKHT